MNTLLINSFDEARILKDEATHWEKAFFEAAKRIIDVVLSLILGVVTLIILPSVALAIKSESPGPILFRQKRVGQNGKIFWLLKFRSTYRTSVDETAGWGDEGENIYTNVGKYLRMSYLDELPQIINVLKGEMSLIGPRPERPEFVEILKKEIPFYQMRLMVRPGLTGWAQVNMQKRAYAHEAEKKLRYDLYYIKNRSLWLDFKIIIKTFTILSRRMGR